MKTKDKALLIGWAGVIIGLVTWFGLAHTRLPLNDVITTDAIILGLCGVALLLRRTLTMKTKDKALLIGWAGVIIGSA